MRFGIAMWYQYSLVCKKNIDVYKQLKRTLINQMYFDTMEYGNDVVREGYAR